MIGMCRFCIDLFKQVIVSGSWYIGHAANRAVCTVENLLEFNHAGISLLATRANLVKQDLFHRAQHRGLRGLAGWGLARQASKEFKERPQPGREPFPAQLFLQMALRDRT